jgi:hypothetical protein
MNGAVLFQRWFRSEPGGVFSHNTTVKIIEAKSYPKLRRFDAIVVTEVIDVQNRQYFNRRLSGIRQ